MAFEPQYIKDVTRTESLVKAEDRPVDLQVVLATIQMSIASNALLDLFKKWYFYPRAVDPQLLREAISSMRSSYNLISEAVDFQSTELFAGDDVLKVNTRLLHGGVGIATEAGELLEPLLAALLGKDFDSVNFAEELGDIGWYQGIIFDESGVTADAVFNKVIEKLRHRYPEKFATTEANDRDLVGEREILETLETDAKQDVSDK